jgi:hypothetical protein
MLRLATFAFMLAALTGAGCGDDEDDSGQPAPSQGESTTTTETAAQREPKTDDGTISKSEYNARADPICRAARAELAGNGREIADAQRDASEGKITPSEYFEEAARLEGESAKAGAEAAAELQALPSPSSGQEALDRYLAGVQLQADNLKKQAEALGQRDQAEVARLNQKATLTSARLAEASKEFGFHVCGNPDA